MYVFNTGNSTCVTVDGCLQMKNMIVYYNFFYGCLIKGKSWHIYIYNVFYNNKNYNRY